MPIVSPNATPMPAPRATERRNSPDDEQDDDNALVESMVTGDETQLDCSNSQASGDNFHLWGALLPALPDLQRVDFVKPQNSYKLGRLTKVFTPGVDLRFTASDKISKEHCKITWNEETDEVVVTDLSTNGTHINDRRLERGQSLILQQGHEVTFGARSNHICFLYRHFGKGQTTPTARGVFEEYQLSSEIGRGGFGTVRRAIGLSNGQTYAVKVINNRQFAVHEGRRRMVEREILILSQLEHPNIVRWVETFSDPAAIYLVMEFVDGGDLLSLIIRSKTGIAETMGRCLTHNICAGTAFLHAKGIVHRDLKPENVLVTRNQPMLAKIADFGLAKVVDSETMLNTQCGTPMYVAPEVWLGTPHNNSLAYTPLVDSWSVGAIVYAMLTMSVPFPDDDSNMEVRERLQHREVQWDHMKGTSDEAQHFCRNLLRKDVRLRFTMDQALMHPWLNDPYIDLSQGWTEEYDGTPPEVLSPRNLKTYVRSSGDAAEEVSHLYSSAEPSVDYDLESLAHAASVEHLTGLDLKEKHTSSR